MVERLELLKIIDIVRKIESENKYIEKMSKIDDVRKARNKKQDYDLEKKKTKEEKS